MSKMKNLQTLITYNYDVKIDNIILLDEYFGTEIYRMESDIGKYIVKVLPIDVPNLENEVAITEFLYANGVPVARLLKNNDSGYVVKTDKIQFHIQEFIEGKVFKVNTASEWLMKKSADMLGRIHGVLQNYSELSVNFGGDFFSGENAVNQKQYYVKELNEAADSGNSSLILGLGERIKHLDRISKFHIDSDKLSYSNSHGDFYIGQIIVNNKDITVIDWTSACKLPISLEVIMSYVFASPDCRNGEINSEGLTRYLNNYTKHFRLNDYDIKMMPYVFYFQQIMCHYPPPYDGIPDTYKPVCNLINNFTNWLYKNAESLEKELTK